MDEAAAQQKKKKKKKQKDHGAPGWKQKKLQEMREWRKQMKDARKEKRSQIRVERNKEQKLERESEPESIRRKVAEKPAKREQSKMNNQAEPDAAQEDPDNPKKKKKKTRNSEDGDHGAVEIDETADPEAFKVCVAGLPPHVSEKLLQRDFSECGEIRNIRLLRDKTSGKSRGIAFISFTGQAAMDAALAYDGEQYGGRSLWVKIAEKSTNNKSKGSSKGNDTLAGPGVKPAGCTTVILRGLAYSVLDADLMERFQECGNGPSNVDVLFDKETGASRGIAFVDFEDEAAVDEAIKLNGTELKGRRFFVNYATPRVRHQEGPGEKPEGCTSVLVKGLAYSVMDADLMKMFKKCEGGPTNVRMVLDKKNGTSRGMAFIDFKTGSAVDTAINLNGKELQGRRIIVEYAKTTAEKDERDSAEGDTGKVNNKVKGPGKKPAGCTSVTVKGLSDSVTEKKLMKMFKSCGEGPRNVNIVMDNETGASTGLAFVNFWSEEAVDEAMKLNGTELKGQSVILGYVKPKKREKF